MTEVGRLREYLPMFARPINQLLGGVAIGIVASLSIAIGSFAAFAGLVLLVVVGLVLPQFWFLAGGLLGIGGIWFVLTFSSVVACQATANLCGGANVFSLAALSFALVVLSVALALVTIAKYRQRLS